MRLATSGAGQQSVPGGDGHAAGLKVSALVSGMLAGADSIADIAVLRHGGMDRAFTGVRAPSTLGTFLRRFRFGHVRQLDTVAARFRAAPCSAAPIIAGDTPVAHVDIDDTVRVTHGCPQAVRRLRLPEGQRTQRVDRRRVQLRAPAGDRRDPAPQRGGAFSPGLRPWSGSLEPAPACH